MLQLREFHLQLAFMRARALRKDVEDEAGAVDDSTFGQLLEVAFLHRAERMVDQDQVSVERGAMLTQLLRLAGADEVARIGSLDARAQTADDTRTCGAGQFGEFVERTRVGTTGRLR